MNSCMFNTIPGYIFGYWISRAILESFANGRRLDSISDPKKGLSTGNNDRFFRLWFEISINDAYFGAADYIQAMFTGKKWFPISKGGEYRKWYGNNSYIVNYQNNGKELLSFEGAIIRNSPYYFLESLTWTDLTSGDISFRYNEKGFIHDVAGPCVFNLDANLKYVFGLLNSKVANKILSFTSPTLHYNIGTLCDFPVIINEEYRNYIEGLVSINVEKTKTDWDSFEESWDFKKHPLA